MLNLVATNFIKSVRIIHKNVFIRILQPEFRGVYHMQISIWHLAKWVECSVPGRVIPKTFKKWYLIPPCLTLNNIRYVSRIKWSNSIHLGVVAIEKGAFWSPSTTVANFTYLLSIWHLLKNSLSSIFYQRYIEIQREHGDKIKWEQISTKIQPHSSYSFHRSLLQNCLPL